MLVLMAGLILVLLKMKVAFIVILLSQTLLHSMKNVVLAPNSLNFTTDVVGLNSAKHHGRNTTAILALVPLLDFLAFLNHQYKSTKSLELFSYEMNFWVFQI